MVPTEVIVVEGILLFADDAICQQLQLRVFRDCPEEIRFARRIERDRVERGRSLESIEAQLAATVKPMHDQFVQPYASRAHVVTRHGDDLGAVTEELLRRVMGLVPSTR